MSVIIQLRIKPTYLSKVILHAISYCDNLASRSNGLRCVNVTETYVVIQLRGCLCCMTFLILRMYMNMDRMKKCSVQTEYIPVVNSISYFVYKTYS